MPLGVLGVLGAFGGPFGASLGHLEAFAVHWGPLEALWTPFTPQLALFGSSWDHSLALSAENNTYLQTYVIPLVSVDELYALLSAFSHSLRKAASI